jgi:hypothetical protein
MTEFMDKIVLPAHDLTSVEEVIECYEWNGIPFPISGDLTTLCKP